MRFFLSKFTSIKTVEKGSNNQEKAKISLVASHHLELILSCSESLFTFYFSFLENISLLQIGPPLSDSSSFILWRLVAMFWKRFVVQIIFILFYWTEQASLSTSVLVQNSVKKSEIVTTLPCPCVLCPNQFPNVSLAVFTTDSWERSSWLWRGSELQKINCWIFDSVFSLFIIQYHFVISAHNQLLVIWLCNTYTQFIIYYIIYIFIILCIIGTQTTSSYMILYFL